MKVLCFDVGGTSIKHAMISDGTIEAKGSTPTLYSKKEFFDTLKKVIEDYAERYDFNDVSLSFPGFINPHTGFAETAGALEFLLGSNILDQLSEAVGQDFTYHIENDANCAAIAEKNSGRTVDNRSFLLATVGTGFGGAFYINNELVRGFQFKAGEFGRMRVMTRTNIDKVVNTLISVKMLIKQYKEMRGLSDDVRISGEDILDVMSEDQETEALVLQWIHDICVALFNVTTVINPEKILIGGGISSHPAFLPLVRENMDTMDDWYEFKVPIETCKYNNDAGVLGAYYNAVG
ncbi:MAG: ROK family protein [Alkalibacterium sp.]|nr:ROK family protein [Alkalibacterium sp.]